MSDSATHFKSATHFGAVGGTARAAGRFVTVDRIAGYDILPGLNFRPIMGESMIANYVTFAPNSIAPMHQHAEEQITLIVHGACEFTIGDQTQTLRPGDVAMMPPWVWHAARTGDDGCVAIDVFTPPRATLIEHASAQRDASSSVVANSIDRPPDGPN